MVRFIQVDRVLRESTTCDGVYPLLGVGFMDLGVNPSKAEREVCLFSEIPRIRKFPYQ